MTSEAATVTEYRLSWESPDPWKCAAVEDAYGKRIWPSYDWDSLGDWHRTEVVFLYRDDRMGQYHTLKQWAETREQPIRNVRLEKRQVPEREIGWEPV